MRNFTKETWLHIARDRKCLQCAWKLKSKTFVEKENVLDLKKITEAALTAKKNGATRFCLGAAWRSPPKKDFPKILAMIEEVKSLGLETCVTLGMLNEEQTQALKEAGLDFYNHNLDTSPSYYKKIITTRTYEDRLRTLEYVREAGIKVCCGGILGMGETRKDRIELLLQLVSLPAPPESVPINYLIPIEGTPLEHAPPIDNIEFIRTIAVARIMMPTSMVRLSANRISMSEEMQTLCFFAGANSIWRGEVLLTTNNPQCHQDELMFAKLGLNAKPLPVKSHVTEL